jgi:two-component system chemotaxis response regulator CheY
MAEYRSVLIVDDSSTSRMIVQRCIEMAGVKVGAFVCAENGLDALALLKKDQSIELVVTDLNMPKMDGRAFARIVKNDPSFGKIQLIVVSSIADGDAEAELMGLGALAVVKKPVSPAKMNSVLGGLS